MGNWWLNFASAVWFFVTPQSPKPSMLQVLDRSWTPNRQDRANCLEQGFGATTMVVNGALECGSSPSNPTGAANRAKFYRRFAKRFGLDISGEKLGCKDSKPFPQVDLLDQWACTGLLRQAAPWSLGKPRSLLLLKATTKLADKASIFNAISPWQ